MADKGEFIGKSMTYGYSEQDLHDIAEGKYRTSTGIDMSVEGSVRWRNRRPICPYGCGEEGNLLEIIVKDGKGIGIYTHSGSIKPFTAELQMSPKPTGRKLVIGADGEPHLEEDV